MDRGLIISKLEEAWGEIRANARLRLGLWAVAGIVGLQIGFWLQDLRGGAVLSYGQAQKRLARVEAMAGEREWVARAEEARRLRVTMEERLWVADSKGLAQAVVQNWLDQRVAALNLQKARVNTQPAVEMEGGGGYWQVTAKVEGSYRSHEVEALLAEMAGYERLLVVDSLQVSRQREPRFTLVVKAFFSMPGG